ncbi:POLLEN OLE E I FAMILY ALLERGEN [Salix koriyanagi]|uniref:POLLEN OLE E I FAMILY ALLERGEN n=1 Tax=Salix koriyanagi TaxID=2511006 RepID=A0A9Q0YUK6_9ROSI|nr:POLLEN OLE E I FAMILY ALLERGEN [Salix koriyanagi]
MALASSIFSILLLSSLIATSANDYGHGSKKDTVKPGYHPKSDVPDPKPGFEYDPKPNVDQPKLTAPEPNHGYDSIGIEGLVLCRSGYNYIPVKGALVRIACMAVDQNGYETTPFSCLTGAADANGYYFKTLPAFADFRVAECKAYLESSPLETCKIPTDVNDGISGALLSSYHILSSKRIKLYSMRTLFYTSETTPTPAGGY